MIRKAILILTLMLVGLLAVASVSATDNITDDVIGIEETTDEIFSVEETNIDSSKINEIHSDFMDYNFTVLSSNDNSEVLGVKETHFDDFKYGDRFSSLLDVPLRDVNNNLIYNEKVTYSFDNITAPTEYLSHQSIRMPNDLKMGAYHFITLKYAGSSTYAPCEKTIAFKYVSGRFGTIVSQIPTKLEFEFVDSNIYHDSMKVYLKDGLGNVFPNLLFSYTFDDNETVFQQYSKSEGNTIKLDFSPLTKHKITINFKGNELFKKSTISKSFSIASSIRFSEYDGEFVEGGKNIPCYLYYKDGNLKEVRTIFAPFGISTINITNVVTGQSIVRSVNILKQELKANPLFTYYADLVEYKVRVIENDEYVVNKEVTFKIEDETYNATTNDNGFATLKIHLKAGTYTITAKYENIINSSKIYISPVYVGNKCKNAYISVVNEYYNQNLEINYGWEGNLDGYFKIFKGNSLVYNKRINTGSTVSDYFEYNKHDYNHVTNQLSVGSYTAKLVADDGTILKTSSFKIIKTPTDLSIGSKNAKSGKKITISSNVLDDITGGCAKTANGQVTLTINGKTYSAKVKNGKFSISFKAPSKAKKYTSKLIYSGDSNYKSSSVKFKLTVKKSSTIKKTSTIKKKPKTKKTTTTKKEVKFTVMVPVNFNKKISRTHGNYKVQTYKYCANDYWLSIKIYKNGKILKKFKAKYHIYVANGKGVSVTVDNNKWHKTVSARTIINAYKVKATVWV